MSLDPRTRSMLSTYLSYFRPHLALFTADTLCAIGLAGVDLAFPQILRQLTSGLFTQGPAAILSALPWLALGMAVLFVLRYFFRWFVTSWGHIMGVRMEAAMRQDLFDAYERFSFGYFDRHNTGDLMSRVVSDLFSISEASHHGPEWIVICTLEIVGSFVILATISWQLSLVLALVTVLLFAYAIRAQLRLTELFRENRRSISRVNSQLEDSLGGMRVVKSFANEAEEARKFAVSNEGYRESKVRNYLGMGRFFATVGALTGALYLVIVVMGGWLVAQGQMNAVDLATYALYISLFLGPIQTILDFTEMFQEAKAGFERFYEVITTPPDVAERPDAKPLVVSEGRVVYDDVHFAYENGEDDGELAPDAPHVLKGMNLVVEPGQTLALVGPSGGGKSTTCALLPRFYDVTAGSISIDGQDVRDVTLESLRRAIGMVQQDVYLFDGTIGENIAYGKPGASVEEVRAAAAAANIAEFIEGLPEGYDTRVGERGARLSGGQKQRVAIARVFLKNPKILVLDEATSALDNESEQAVQESLARLAEGRTALVIAHRLSTIRGADEIAAVSDGRVVERGTHAELLELDGIYARYHRMQFGE